MAIHIQNIGKEDMPYKSVFNIIAVWIANGIAWLFALSLDNWFTGLQVIKESIAIISLLIAIGFTLYKWRQSWNGWNPRRKKK
jgi:putative flippase GtrA